MQFLIVHYKTNVPVAEKSSLPIQGIQRGKNSIWKNKRFSLMDIWWEIGFNFKENLQFSCKMSDQNFVTLEN